MDADALVIAQALVRATEQSAKRSCPVLLTGPDADVLASRLEALSIPDPVFCIDPLYRKGHAVELLKVAQNSTLLNNEGDDIFSGPEYLRPSDAELKARFCAET
jgi:hypothetical protein